ncbi:hypothetical protein GGR34_001097 [Microvirga flocculans]|uniref:Uncharacterized protein n=1 Tax=Microvirga flocculans TaxID=217168 RepID=A0A7W6IDG1_9HYPH|nr:hypothetical protein [Microvirga flocculans]
MHPFRDEFLPVALDGFLLFGGCASLASLLAALVPLF